MLAVARALIAAAAAVLLERAVVRSGPLIVRDLFGISADQPRGQGHHPVVEQNAQLAPRSLPIRLT